MDRATSKRGSSFACMAGCYCLGIFNDNFFRQAVSLLAISIGWKSGQDLVLILFVLPYLLVAAPAGWLADRFPKGRVVVWAKVLELCAMVCGTTGILLGNWILILTMAFIMGLQSCLFGPALNGTIPEVYPPAQVPRANGILKVVVTSSILVGMTCSGTVRDLGREAGEGDLYVALVVLIVSLLGLALSLGVPRRPAADPERPFPWTGPLDTFRELKTVSRDRLLNLIFYADALVWSVGALIILQINLLAKEQLQQEDTMASILLGFQLGGLALGGLLGGFLGSRPGWKRLLPPAAGVLSLALVAFAGLPYLEEGSRIPVAMALLVLTGFSGGLFMIPCEAFIQIRPEARRKGAVIAASNFLLFACMIPTALLNNLASRFLTPTNCLALAGVCFLGFTGLLVILLKRIESSDA